MFRDAEDDCRLSHRAIVSLFVSDWEVQNVHEVEANDAAVFDSALSLSIHPSTSE